MQPGDIYNQLEAVRIHKSRLTQEQVNLIRAHNNSPDGIRLGHSKNDRKTARNTPLFREDNQTNLF